MRVLRVKWLASHSVLYDHETDAGDRCCDAGHDWWREGDRGMEGRGGGWCLHPSVSSSSITHAASHTRSTGYLSLPRPPHSRYISSSSCLYLFWSTVAAALRRQKWDRRHILIDTRTHQHHPIPPASPSSPRNTPRQQHDTHTAATPYPKMAMMLLSPQHLRRMWCSVCRCVAPSVRGGHPPPTKPPHARHNCQLLSDTWKRFCRE